MSEKKVKQARKEARERGEHTVAAILTKGEQIWPQWPSRAGRRAKHKAEVAETRRDLREKARKTRFAKQHGNKKYAA